MMTELSYLSELSNQHKFPGWSASESCWQIQCWSTMLLYAWLFSRVETGVCLVVIMAVDGQMTHW